MSIPDARLSAAERAALADLESAATAADPHLAARLRGRASAGPIAAIAATRPVLHLVRARLLRVWAWTLGRCWLAVPLVLGGLLLTMLGLSAGLGLSVFGAVLTAVGLRLVAEVVDRRYLQAPPDPSRRSRSADS